MQRNIFFVSNQVIIFRMNIIVNFIVFTIILVVSAIKVEDYTIENQLRNTKIEGNKRNRPF